MEVVVNHRDVREVVLLAELDRILVGQLPAELALLLVERDDVVEPDEVPVDSVDVLLDSLADVLAATEPFSRNILDFLVEAELLDRLPELHGGAALPREVPGAGSHENLLFLAEQPLHFP